MVRPRKEEQRTEFAEAIKAAARQQMSELGTAGLSLRGISRQLGVTAPAIYNYFPRLDDLITALIVDAFNAVTDAMQAADDDLPETATAAERIRARALAYRAWAIENPIQFQLIYGNPIPGYVAPPEITDPLAFKPWEGMYQLFIAAFQAGQMHIPEEYACPPPTIMSYLTSFQAEQGINAPHELIYLLSASWSRLHGAIMLELFHHLQPSIGDTAAFYAKEVDVLLVRCGLVA